jgi:LysR family hydrogen peroxide-inducible transcriptional activator
MNLRALHYLIALADCLNFSRAADRCAVTQPTLSIQLRKLEDYLGVMLFDRNRAHVMLTADGEEVLRLARIAVGAEEEILHMCRARLRELRVQAAPALIDEINYPPVPGG